MDDIDKLIEQLKSPDANARINAAKRLGELKDPGAIPALEKALNDSDSNVRCEAKNSLVRLRASSHRVAKELRDLMTGQTLLKSPQTLYRVEETEVIPLVNVLASPLYYPRQIAFDRLERKLQGCKTIEDVLKFESEMSEGYDRIKKKEHKGDEKKSEIEIARLRTAVAMRKNELAHDKGILLDGIPKPPKPNKGIYQSARVMRNG